MFPFAFSPLAVVLSQLLLSLAWILPLLVVAVSGLWLLRRAPPGKLRQRTLMAVWILIAGQVLQLLKTLLVALYLLYLPGQGTGEGFRNISPVMNFGVLLLQALSYWLLLRIAVQAVRRRHEEKPQGSCS